MEKLLDSAKAFLTYEVLYVQDKTNQCLRGDDLKSVIDWKKEWETKDPSPRSG